MTREELLEIISVLDYLEEKLKRGSKNNRIIIEIINTRNLLIRDYYKKV